MVPCTVKTRKTYHHKRQKRSHQNCRRNGAAINKKPNASDTEDLGVILCGNIRGFFRINSSTGVQDHALESDVDINDPDKCQSDACQIWWTHCNDFGITPHYDCICVMAHVAGLPDCGVTHYHKTSELIDCIVHPSGFECGLMTTFMPTRVCCRPIKNTINQPERHGPNRWPKCDRTSSTYNHHTEPYCCVAY